MLTSPSEARRKWSFAIKVLASFVFVAAAPVSVASQSDYKVEAGDTLSFDILDDDEQPVNLLVGDAGRISVPLLGSVEIAGLTIAEINSVVRSQLVNEGFHISPRILINVSAYRQIFVIGDVKNPGAYPFRSKLTVETAVGLAGGLNTSSSSVDSQILERTKLQSSVEAVEAELAKEALAYARLTAQLAGRQAISTSDLPVSAAPFVREATFKGLLTGEEKILVAESASFEAERRQLQGIIEESKNGIIILGNLAKAQETTINQSKEDLARKAGLLSRGYNTVGDVSVIQRQLSADEARLLTIQGQLSDNRRAVSSLQRELTRLENNRQKDALLAQQEKTANIRKHLATRQSMIEQISLLGVWTSEAGQQQRQPAIKYRIKRDVKLPAEQETTGTSLVSPGDVVLVTLERPIISPVPATGRSLAEVNSSR